MWCIYCVWIQILGMSYMYMYRAGANGSPVAHDIEQESNSVIIRFDSQRHHFTVFPFAVSKVFGQ